MPFGMKKIFTQKFFFYSFLGILTLQSTSIFASTSSLLASYNIVDDIGCTDPCAPNYDPEAIDDDGSCLPYDTSCNNDCAVGEIQEWNPLSCSCVPISIIDGCTIETACNYNPLANCNDDSCEFGATFCLDPCSALPGCTNPEACNFDASADCDDGSCAYVVETVDAGMDQNVCGFTGTLAATGEGRWSSNFGGVSFADPYDPTTEVTVLQEGSYIFFWNVNEDCTDGTATISDPVTIFFIETDAADAGENVMICNDQYELNAAEPVGLLASGTWSVVFGGGIFGNVTDPNTTVTNLSDGVNVLAWTTSSPLCPNGSVDELVITVGDENVVPYAGVNDTICGLSYNLDAQDDLGMWVGDGVFDNPINSNTTVTVDTLGTYPFVWTLSGFCGGGTDTVYITFKDDNLQAEAGSIQNICGLTTNLNAMLGSDNTGMWVSNFGGVNFEEPTNPNSSVTVSQIGTYVFFWTEMATCGLETMSMTDQVIIVFSENDMPETGDDIVTCDNTAVLSANTPDPGNSGSWSIVQGYGEFEDANDPNTPIANLAEGVNIFEWTIVTTNCGVNSEPLTIDVGISGCLDATACNYNAEATCMIACDYESCLVGCTDPCAPNYSTEALNDDGSCEVYDTVCDDGCALTTDLYDFNVCACTNIVNTTLDDGCAVTNDYLDTENCVVVHEPINLDDGCPLTTDIFDAANCLIINENPSPDDGCDLTLDTFNAANCEIINIPIVPDDGCPSTIESFDMATCTIITQYPNVDDGCDLTNDYFDVETCLIVNENPDVSDGCDLTFDAFNASSCTITHIPVIPEDGCAATVETLDLATCTIISTPPNCGDLNPNTTDFFDFDNCICVNENIGCGDVICDDGCALTVDSIDEATCECVFTAPSVDDGCPLTVDSFDAANCVVVNQTPSVDDGCPLTVDSFDTANCVVVNQTPNVDDGCAITTDSFDALNCTILNEPVITDDGCAATIEVFDAANCMVVSNPPNCDDLNPNTTDFFDFDNCTCVSEMIGCGDLVCDDGCALTVDSIDEATCECVFTAPSVDDGCPLTVDSFDAANCVVVNQTPSVDDGCDLTVDSFNAVTCTIVNEPILTDDGCPLTTEIFNEATCSVIHNPPNCDDGDLNTIDFFDFDNCACVNEDMCGDIICDDGCDLTTDSLNQMTCECVFVAPNVEDDCVETNDYFDFDNCVIVNEVPDVDDGCDLTIDYFNPSICMIVHEPIIADDGCDLTTAVFNEISCVIIHNPPNCSDFNSNTIDYFDFDNCTCVNEMIGCGDIICDDGCDLTTDSLNEETCQCVFTTPAVDDGCTATLDYFDALNCAVVNELMNLDDGCDITVDSFDTLTCTILHEPIIPDDGCDETVEVFDVDECMIVTVSPDCDDGNVNTTDFFDVASCSCNNQIMCDDIVCDDGCDLTTDTLNELTCECVFVAPDVDDGCAATNDYFDFNNCAIVNENPVVDDGCDLTFDFFNASICAVVNEPIITDDGCDETIEVFNEISCVIIHNPPDCSDGDVNTLDYFDFDNCTCVNEPTDCGDIICDDGCDLTIDSLDENTCECIFTAPNVDDGCDLTADSFDAATCTILNEPPIPDDGCDLTVDSFDAATCSIISNPPSCNDFNPNTNDYFDFDNCMCINEMTGPCGDNIVCDDGCGWTTDILDPETCECVFMPPFVDDGCALTTDSFDAANCMVIHEPPVIDDGCDLTIDFFNPETCMILNEPVNVPIDDGCNLTNDYFDFDNCVVVNEAPNVDDGCDLTFDVFDALTCSIEHMVNCDDSQDCTEDTFDAVSCNCVYTPLCATVTGVVFIDNNNNSLNDPGDDYANNISVTLFNINGTIAAQTTTDIAGIYLFENVASGDYYLHFDIPVTYTTIIPNVGNENVDSDVGTDGTTASFTVNNGDFIEHISAGLSALSFDCEEFIADIVIDCKDDHYELVLSFIGAGPNGYVVTNNLTGGQITTTNENIVLSPFEFGTNFNYTVYLADNPSCSESFLQTIVDCALTAVELIDFSGMVVEEGNLLQWSTASEFNNDYFKLMRSTDGINFEEIHRQDGAGNSSLLHTYEFLDQDAPTGIAYYRLDQVDFDGKEISSDIIPLERQESHTIIGVYPNPSTDFINVQYLSTDESTTQISVYNTQGQLVRFLEKESIAGANIETISTTDFSAGLYFLEVSLDRHSIQKTKFIKR